MKLLNLTKKRGPWPTTMSIQPGLEDTLIDPSHKEGAYLSYMSAFSTPPLKEEVEEYAKAIVTLAKNYIRSHSIDGVAFAGPGFAISTIEAALYDNGIPIYHSITTPNREHICWVRGLEPF
jgi:hypothetical protein